LLDLSYVSSRVESGYFWHPEEVYDTQSGAGRERRAVDDDGVFDRAHVSDHAGIRRMGHACSRCNVQTQPRYDVVLEHSRVLDDGLLAARAALVDEAA
jgi:hypothetical protein